MSFEISFLEALQTPSNASIVGNKLALRTAKDAITVRFTAIDQADGKDR
jgi:heat shock protein HslJ